MFIVHAYLKGSPTMVPTRSRLACLVSLALLGGIAALPASAQTIVAPNSFAAANAGGRASTAPLNDVSRYQQIYAASQFSALTGPELITQIAFRPATTQGAFTYTDSRIQFDLSTNTEAVSSLSPTFATNVGSNDQVVYDSALTLTSAGTSASGAGPFDVIVKLTNPFLYDPAAGNLVLDIRNFGPNSTAFLDLGTDSSTRLVFVDNSTTAATGTVQNFGLATQFTFAPVPEASTTVSLGLLLALGLGGMVIAAKRRKTDVKAASSL